MCIYIIYYRDYIMPFRAVGNGCEGALCGWMMMIDAREVIAILC